MIWTKNRRARVKSTLSTKLETFLFALKVGAAAIVRFLLRTTGQIEILVSIYN